MVPPREAAAEILATNVGLTLSLISQPETERDLSISQRVREAGLSPALAAGETPSGNKDGNPSLQTAAIALSAALIRTDGGRADVAPGAHGAAQRQLAGRRVPRWRPT
jgi:hypothetical protein